MFELLCCVAAKLREFNEQCDVNWQFSDADVSSLEHLVSSHETPTSAQLALLQRMLQWPAGLHVLMYTSLALMFTTLKPFQIARVNTAR